MFYTKTLGFSAIEEYRESKGVYKKDHFTNGGSICHSDGKKHQEGTPLHPFFFQQDFFSFLALPALFNCDSWRNTKLLLEGKRQVRRGRVKKKFGKVEGDDNVAWEDVLAFNEQNVVDSGWKPDPEGEAVEGHIVATCTERDDTVLI